MKHTTSRQTMTATVDIDSRNRITVANAYEIREELKARGMRWDGRVWYYTPANDEDAARFLKELNIWSPGLETFDADLAEFVNSL